MIIVITIAIIVWLVVLTPLKNINQLGLFFPIKKGKSSKCLERIPINILL